MAYDIATLLNHWQQIGVFDYVLPFLLIFSVVYGIITASKIMSGNRGVNIIISLSVALLSLRFDFVPLFFSQIFPRFGVGMAVFIVVMIFAALWIPNEYMKHFNWIFVSIGGIIAAVVIYKSFDWLGWSGISGGFWDQWGSLILLGVLVITVVVVIAQPWKGEPTHVGPASFGGIASRQ